MASHALDQFEFDPRKTSMRFTEIYSGPLLPASLCHVPAFPRLADGLKISRTRALAGAKGAMAAIGLEGAVVILVYCIWELRHILR